MSYMSNLAVQERLYLEAVARRPAARAIVSVHTPVTFALTTDQRANMKLLPRPILEGLRKLRDLPSPAVHRPEVWREIVADAVSFAADGWMREALRLGWSSLEVYGCAAAREGDDYLLGIAGRLAGRTVEHVSSVSVGVRDGGRNLVLARPGSRGGETIHLWEYGR